MGVRWTEQQQEAIERMGSDILVSAAAGSGKTAVLTERIKRLVVDERVPIDRFLVVTFTNAAASEMKEKTLKALRKAKEERPEDRAFLNQQIRKASSASISTFHSFSINVIRRFFYLTGADAKFAICDDGRRQIIQEHCLDQLLEDRFASGEEEFLAFMKRYSDLRSETKVRDLITSTYEFIMSMGSPFEWLDTSVNVLAQGVDEFKNGPAFESIFSELQMEGQRMHKCFEEAYEMVSHLPSLEEKAARDLDKVEGIIEILKLKDMEALASTLGAASFEKFIAKKADKEDYNAIKEEVGNIRDEGKDCLKKMKELLSGVSLDASVERIQDTHRFAAYLAGLVKEYHERFMAEKKRLALMDFNDVEHEALAILRHEEAAEAYRKNFQYIFIDEYQDSSLLQEEIIGQVSRGDNVYMVGDVKQSIYKFRLADPDIFVDKYNSFRADPTLGTRIDLNRNFRSKRRILEVTNKVFEKVMTSELGGITYDEAAMLYKGAEIDGEPDGEVSLHLVDAKAPEEMEGELDEAVLELKSAELEAMVTADLVAERIGKEIFDSQTGRTRPAGYGDIVILLRGIRSKGDLFVKALQDKGIPVYIEGGDGYFETNEIDVFMNLLRVIDNRYQDIPLLSVLRSPIFDFSVDELIEIRLRSRNEAGIRRTYAEAFLLCAGQEERDELADKCAAVCACLDEWRRYARFMPLPELIRWLMEETGYLNYVSAMPGGEHRSANLRTLVDKAVDFTELQAEGLFGFVRYAEAVSKNNVRISQAGSGGDVRNMVRIMTIHKSKGLEFPIVIAASTATKFNFKEKASDLKMHKNLGIGMTYADPDRMLRSKTLPQIAISKRNRLESLAEEARILYVAMTRAVDELVMVACSSRMAKILDDWDKGALPSNTRANSFLDWILPAVNDAQIECKMYGLADMAAAEEDAREKAETFREELEQGFPSFRDDRGLLAEIHERFEYIYPNLPFVISKSKYTATELNRALKGELSLIPQKVRLETESEYAENYLAPEDIMEVKGWAETPDEEPAAESCAAGVGADAEAADGAHAEELPVTWDVPKFMRDEEEMTPARRGTLTHKVLELIDFTEEHDRDSVEAFVRKLVSKGIFTEKEADAVNCKNVAAFFHSEIGRRACRASMLKREWAFTLKKRSSELIGMAENREVADQIRSELPDEILIQGIIDCCFRDEAGLVILDFKTDYVRDEDRANGGQRFVDEYWRQLSIYREVVEKATGEKVQRTVLYMLRSGETIDIP